MSAEFIFTSNNTKNQASVSFFDILRIIWIIHIHIQRAWATYIYKRFIPTTLANQSYILVLALNNVDGKEIQAFLTTVSKIDCLYA